MSLWSRIILALQIAAALGTELVKLSVPGAEAVVPPAGVPAFTVSTEEARFEIRLHVKRVR